LLHWRLPIAYSLREQAQTIPLDHRQYGDSSSMVPDPTGPLVILHIHTKNTKLAL
jgi:hypothetical protein